MTRGHGLVVAAGAALLATSFVPLWATYRVPGLGIVAPKTIHQNAWTAYGFSMQLALLLAVVAAGFVVVLAAKPDLDLPHKELVPLGLCVGATLLLAWQAIAGPEGSSNPNGYGIARGILLFTGVLFAATMTYGSELVRRETGADRRGSGMMSPGRPGRARRGE